MFTIGGVVARFSNANFQSYKPAFWLVREVGSGDVIIASAAARELSSRVAAGGCRSGTSMSRRNYC
jgi:hypothetical protein